MPSIPVFDWGESDFNFNVPVTGKSINVEDAIAQRISTGKVVTDGLLLGKYDVSNLFYAPNDTATFFNSSYAGYISSGATTLYFTIPLSKINHANKVSLSGNIIGRGVNGYINNIKWSEASGFENFISLSGNKEYTVTTSLADNCINVVIQFTSNITNGVNNTPITITPIGGSITATFI